jgi:hypothetical protein
MDTIHHLTTEANKYPDIDCVCCKEIKIKEFIPQVRFNKMAKQYKDMPNMAGASMPMIRRAAGIEENLRGNTSIIVQKAIVKTL